MFLPTGLLSLPYYICAVPNFVYTNSTDPVLDAFFQERFSYYSGLTEQGRTKFLGRLGTIINNKRFIGREGLTVTNEMGLLISACWVQVTFGLDDYLTEEYEEVHIYPSAFFSTRAEHMVKGLTTTEGAIFISWRDFVEDYKYANNLNVGMHEITHAMLISAAYKHNFDEFFSNYYHAFFENIKEDFWDLRRGYTSYLRGYGGSNYVEFLSVSVEAFFENPAELKDKMPELYYNLSVLLKQDPLNTTGDYKVSKPLLDEIRFANVDHGIPEGVLQQLSTNPTLNRQQNLMIAFGALVFGVIIFDKVPVFGLMAIGYAVYKVVEFIKSFRNY